MSELIEQKQGFSLQPANLAEAMELATTISNSEMVPKDYKGKPGNTVVAMMLGSELGLHPIQALQNIAVINGRPSVWGDALLALVQSNPSFESISETFNKETMTATCKIKRKGCELHIEEFSQADAQTAKLWGKQGPWTQYPKRMLALRARGFALRSVFADALCGLVSVEEAQDYNITDITSASSVETIHTPENVVNPEPEIMPIYPQDKFDASFPKFKSAIEAGSKKPTDIINMVQSKFTLTEEMKTKINNVKVAA